jgi:hypothetical protein
LHSDAIVFSDYYYVCRAGGIGLILTNKKKNNSKQAQPYLKGQIFGEFSLNAFSSEF